MSHPSLLLSGSSGFVGSSVVRALAETRSDFANIWLAGRSSVESFAGMSAWPLDLTDEVLKLPRGIDVVIHLAGEKRSEDYMWRVNVDGTRKMVEAAAAAGASRFVNLSSVGVYGAPMHSGNVTEGTPHRPMNAYERSKDLAEEYVRDRCRELGMEWIVLQPSNVLGVVPGKSTPLLGFIRALKQGRILRFGRESAVFNYVALEDVAAAVVQSASARTHDRTWIINSPATLDDAISWLADELHIDARVHRMPTFVGQLAVQVLEPLARLAGLNSPIDSARLRELSNTTLYDGSAIVRDIGFAYMVGAERLFRSLATRYRLEGLL